MKEKDDKGFHDIHCNGVGVLLSPIKAKNRLKTPEQVQALEEVYKEHKYPSETLKLELANQIGLSHKQVSRWFFHRRMKDKKLLQNDVSGNDKQNISDGLINDHNSGIEQESCSSSKQGNLHPDTEDIQSKRRYGDHPSKEVILLQKKASRARVADSLCSDSRPRSSLEWQERARQHDNFSEATKFSNYFFADENQNLTNRRSLKSKEVIMDSKYHYFKDGNENYAISSMKRRLGQFYCEEGPILGVHFDPLPPGAFDSNLTEPTTELLAGLAFNLNSVQICGKVMSGETCSICSCNLINTKKDDPHCTSDYMKLNPWKRRKIIKQPEVHENYIYKTIPNASHTKRDILGVHMQGPLHPIGFPNPQSNQKTFMVKHSNLFQDQTCPVEKAEDFGRYAMDSSCRRIERCLKSRPKGVDNSMQHPHDQYTCDSFASQDEDVSNREFLKPASKSTHFQKNRNTIMPIRNLKKERILEQRRIEHPEMTNQEMLITIEPRMRSKLGNATEFQKQGYVQSADKLASMKKKAGCSVGMETSLDEDEDLDITSSMN